MWGQRKIAPAVGETNKDVVVSPAPWEEAVNLKDRIEVFDRDSKLLEEITSSYPQESAQHQALRRAQSALWCVLLEGNAEFQNCIESDEHDSSSPQKKH